MKLKALNIPGEDLSEQILLSGTHSIQSAGVDQGNLI